MASGGKPVKVKKAEAQSPAKYKVGCTVRLMDIFFVQPKWRIASDLPGSGNTRNIGGITKIKDLIEGNGPFSSLGEDVFDDYWMGYFNKVDARTAGIGTPRYHNLKTYQEYLESQAAKLEKMNK